MKPMKRLEIFLKCTENGANLGSFASFTWHFGAMQIQYAQSPLRGCSD